MGGTSAINAMASIRGQPEDYDGWAAMGCEGWAWDDVKESFKRIETDIHGGSGPMQLKRWTPETFQPILWNWKRSRALTESYSTGKKQTLSKK
jgi:choline dehydrogenase